MCTLDICGKRLSKSIRDFEYILRIKPNRVEVSIVVSTKDIKYTCSHGLNVGRDIPIKVLEDKLKEIKIVGDGICGLLLTPYFATRI